MGTGHYLQVGPNQHAAPGCTQWMVDIAPNDTSPMSWPQAMVTLLVLSLEI